MKEKVIAIIGRPNVGKSTLINRIAGKRLSVVDYKPNITRGGIYIDCQWQDKKFIMSTLKALQRREMPSANRSRSPNRKEIDNSRRQQPATRKIL